MYPKLFPLTSKLFQQELNLPGHLLKTLVNSLFLTGILNRLPAGTISESMEIVLLLNRLQTLRSKRILLRGLIYLFIFIIVDIILS